jgi:hypothetical protein
MILNFKKTLEYIILYSDKRQYFIDKVKKPLLMAIEKLDDSNFVARVLLLIEIFRLAKRYPEVTIKNVTRPEAKAILIASDNFFSKLNLKGREMMLRAIIKEAACQVEHDSVYTFLFSRLVEEFNKTGYKPKPYIKNGRDYPFWK